MRFALHYDESFGNGMDPGIPIFLKIFFAIFAVFFVVVLALIIVGMVKSWKAAKAAGLDPLAAEAQLAGKLAQSTLLQSSAERSSSHVADVRTRLDTLDALRGSGSVDEDEYRRQRERILSEL